MFDDSEILAMYREIVNYDGDFGDGIDTPLANPWQMLNGGIPLTEAHRRAACVSALCHLLHEIDNSTYEETLSRPGGKEAGRLLELGLVGDLPLARDAFRAFFQSELAFIHALRPVCHAWVLPATAAADDIPPDASGGFTAGY
ncbi:MAG: hypothetical protein AAF441_08295 [Pseudomonadota bacterium]